MKLTEKQRAELPPEMVTISDAMNADAEGDMETFYALIATVPFPATTLMALKKCGFADNIRELGLDPSLADEKYGPGWLDRDDEKR